MTAEGIAYWKNSLTPRTAFLEIRARVFSQSDDDITYNPSSKTFNQVDRPKASAAPAMPNLNLDTRTQHRGTWKHRTETELRSIGRVRLCVWRNRTVGLRIADPNRAGMRQIEYFRASCEIWGSWPMRTRNLSMKNQKMEIGRQTRLSESTALCV